MITIVYKTGQTVLFDMDKNSEGCMQFLSDLIKELSDKSSNKRRISYPIPNGIVYCYSSGFIVYARMKGKTLVSGNK